MRVWPLLGFCMLRSLAYWVGIFNVRAGDKVRLSHRMLWPLDSTPSLDGFQKSGALKDIPHILGSREPKLSRRIHHLDSDVLSCVSFKLYATVFWKCEEIQPNCKDLARRQRLFVLVDFWLSLVQDSLGNLE